MKRVLVPLAPGFEEIEAITIIDVLRRAGVTVDVAGTEPGPITGSHGITVTPDRLLAGVDADAYDLVALPGGMPGTLHLREHPEVRRVVRELAERGRYTTAICAAPTVLAAAGVTAGRALTSHPSVARELAGAAYRGRRGGRWARDHQPRRGDGDGVRARPGRGAGGPRDHRAPAPADGGGGGRALN